VASLEGDIMSHDPCDTIASSSWYTRDDVADYARSLAGMSANPADPIARAAYLALIAPGETPARAAEMGTMSGCALVARAVLRRFIEHSILDAPYRTGRAMSDLVEIASGAGAICHGTEGAEPGEIVIVGGGHDGGGPEHTWISLGGGFGIDGGQKDPNGWQHILERSHYVSAGRDGPRVIRYVLDVAAILRAFGR
jgi:hypothetical protein